MGGSHRHGSFRPSSEPHLFKLVYRGGEGSSKSGGGGKGEVSLGLKQYSKRGGVGVVLLRNVYPPDLTHGVQLENRRKKKKGEVVLELD